MVRVYHFVDPGTDPYRYGIRWSSPEPMLEAGFSDEQLPYWVIDFYQFWPGYSATGYIYVVQAESATPNIVSVTIESPETGETYQQALDLKADPKRLVGGLNLFRFKVVDLQASEKFSSAANLKVILKWQDQEKALHTNTFNLHKIESREAVWPT